MRIDLNADLGESFGPWKMGHDEDLLSIVTSANIACGFHAGDPHHMRTTVKACKDRQVGIGAHPGFADLTGFGRREILDIPFDQLRAMIIYQIGALQAIAQAEETSVRHVKMHGALANMASRDRRLAENAIQAVQELNTSLTIVVIASTQLEEAAQSQGAKYVSEIFADRAYNDDGTLVSRREPDALIVDPKTCAENILRAIETGHLRSRHGVPVRVSARTVCVHGDTPEAVSIASEIRNRLDQAGVTIATFD